LLLEYEGGETGVRKEGRKKGRKEEGGKEEDRGREERRISNSDDVQIGR
jgi:hypothetical protein